MLRVGTYNLRDYLRRPAEPGEQTRYMALAQVVTRELQPDILAVQEIPGEGGVAALQRLGSDTGFSGNLDNGDYAAAPGGHHNLGLGFLWKPELGMPIGWEVYGGDEYWHVLAALTFLHDGVPVTYYNYHAPPKVGRPDDEVNSQRVAEAQSIVARMAGKQHALLMGDFNSLWCEEVDGQLYDPIPAVTGRDEPPETSVLLNRDPAKIFYNAGLRDVAVALGYRWEPTTGHWLSPPERNGKRRLDRFLFTPAMLDSLGGYGVVRSGRTLGTSDHLPAYTEYEPAALI